MNLEKISLKKQERLIREILERNDPTEMEKLECAEKDPDLDPQVKLLIQEIRTSFASDNLQSAPGEQGIDTHEEYFKAVSKSRRTPTHESLSTRDDDLDTFGRELASKDQ